MESVYIMHIVNHGVTKHPIRCTVSYRFPKDLSNLCRTQTVSVTTRYSKNTVRPKQCSFAESQTRPTLEPSALKSRLYILATLQQSWVNVYNPSAPGNQHFCELLPRANDVINMYMTSDSTGYARFSCERSV